MASVPPRSRARERGGHDLAGRREQDGGVERLGRRVERVAGRRGAEVERQLPGLGRSGHHVHGRALGERDLRGEVGGGAEAVDARAGRRSGSAARRSARIADDARAEQGRGLVVGEPLGQPVGVALVDDRVLGVAAVGVPAGEARVEAQVLVAPAAEAAAPAGVAQPGDADPLADREARARPAPSASTTPDDLVAGHDVAAVRRRGRPRRGAGRCGTPRTPRPAPAPRPGRRRGAGARPARAARRRSARVRARPMPSRDPVPEPVETTVTVIHARHPAPTAAAWVPPTGREPARSTRPRVRQTLVTITSTRGH